MLVIGMQVLDSWDPKSLFLGRNYFDSKLFLLSTTEETLRLRALVSLLSCVSAVEEVAWESSWAQALLVFTHFAISLFLDSKTKRKHPGEKLRLSLLTVQTLAGISLHGLPSVPGTLKHQPELFWRAFWEIAVTCSCLTEAVVRSQPQSSFSRGIGKQEECEEPWAT